MEKAFVVDKPLIKKKVTLEPIRKYYVFLILILLGMAAGVVLANIFQNSYFKAWENWHLQFKMGLASVQVNNQELFVYILMDKLKPFLLPWVLSATIFGVPYLYGYCVYKGFTMGFLFCCVLQEYGMKSFVVLGAYYFPQCLLYVPVFLMVFARCKERNQQWDQKRIMGFLILLLLMILGCALEAYGNPAILKSVF